MKITCDKTDYIWSIIMPGTVIIFDSQKSTQHSIYFTMCHIEWQHDLYMLKNLQWHNKIYKWQNVEMVDIPHY